MQKQIDEYKKLMQRAINLAKKAEGHTSPNPMVGAVIFDENFNIIAEGYHHKAGEPHAEVNAVNAAKCNLEGMSIAVTLEPCSHYGKTPPCCDLLIKNKFKRVIIGTKDPNPLVSGQGIEKLKQAGIEVVTGVLSKECVELNEIFFTNQIFKKPFITIKTATTLDGKIACKTGDSKWITGEESRAEVQKLRNSHDAILTGSGTVIADDPRMTCRLKNGKNPIRIVLDTNLKTNPDSKIYCDDETKVIILASKSAIQKKKHLFPPHIQLLECEIQDEHINITEAIKKLYDIGIKSILIEAGAKINYSFIEAKIADKLVHFVAPKIIGDKEAKNFIEGFDIKNMKQSINLYYSKSFCCGQDVTNWYYFNKFETKFHELLEE